MLDVYSLTNKMKSFVFFAVLLGALCITYSTASPSFSRDSELQMILNQLNEAKAERDAFVEAQDAKDQAALAQIFVHLLENEVQNQSYSDEKKAEIESWLLNKFRALGRKIKGGFKKFGQKVKNAFRG